MKNRVVSRFITGAMAAGIAANCGLVFSVSADKKTEDVTLDASSAIEADAWTQSAIFTYSADDDKTFDATRMTEDSVIKVEYDIIEAHEATVGYPVELIFQSWSNPDTPMVKADGGVWAKVAPVGAGTAEADYSVSEEFAYADIVAAYGTDNFEKVDSILFGATDDAKIKVTGVTITNCLPASEGKHWVDPEIKKAEEKAKKAEEKKDKENKKKNVIGIAAGIVGGIVVAVGVIWFIISRQSKEAFDVSTGEFIDKKDAK